MQHVIQNVKRGKLKQLRNQQYTQTLILRRESTTINLVDVHCHAKPNLKINVNFGHENWLQLNVLATRKCGKKFAIAFVQLCNEMQHKILTLVVLILVVMRGEIHTYIYVLCLQTKHVYTSHYGRGKYDFQFTSEKMLNLQQKQLHNPIKKKTMQLSHTMHFFHAQYKLKNCLVLACCFITLLACIAITGLLIFAYLHPQFKQLGR